MTVNALGQRVFNYGGKKFAKISKRNYSYNRCFYHNFSNKAPRDLIVMYDIPKDMKKEREWFLRHLKKFDYTMIQKSVWVGPSPLPKDFLAYVKSIGLLNQVVTLKLASPYLKGDNNL